MYCYRYNRSTVSAGVASVLTAELDAFIYDGTVLDYLVSQVHICFIYAYLFRYFTDKAARTIVHRCNALISK